MTRNGTVCHAGTRRMAMRFSTMKIAQAMSTRYARTNLRTLPHQSRTLPRGPWAAALAVRGSADTCTYLIPLLRREANPTAQGTLMARYPVERTVYHQVS